MTNQLVEYDVQLAVGFDGVVYARKLFVVGCQVSQISSHKLKGSQYSATYRELCLALDELPYTVFCSVLARHPVEGKYDNFVYAHHTTLHLNPTDALVLAFKFPFITLTKLEEPNDLFREAATYKLIPVSHTLLLVNDHPHKTARIRAKSTHSYVNIC